MVFSIGGGKTKYPNSTKDIKRQVFYGQWGNPYIQINDISHYISMIG